MKIAAAKLNVSQGRRPKLTDVIIVTCYLKSSGVLVLSANSDIPERIIREKRSGMANIAAACIENSATPLFLRS
jgi:hypothetical protein